MLGPSGSGKTTCLMMLAGFETATHGDIHVGWGVDQQYSTPQTWHWHGVPKLRVVSAYDDRRKPILSA